MTTQEPSKTELVIGLVGAIGTNLEVVATRICSILADTFDYECTQIGMSQLLTRINWPAQRDLEADRWVHRTRARMDAGRDLCRAWGAHDALAQLAVLMIAAQREDRGGHGQPLHRHAFILKSLKRPAEVEYLRAIYGNRFVLVGAYTPRPKRRDALITKLETDFGTRDESQFVTKFGVDIDRDLLARDERENGEGGQNVQATFHQADLFVETYTEKLNEQLARGLRILFGDPCESPTKVEAAMSHADRAARRSVEPGRQVGAAVMTERGDVLTVGCNEVPRALGGQYWGDDVSEDGEPAEDAREILNEVDTNNVMQADIAADVVGRLKSYLRPEALEEETALSSQVLRSSLGDTTEFGRAVHAEMAAITTAARLGIPLAGTTLLTDTFPCHNCARHIVATGIKRVVYIAPYAKSRAHTLHPDAIAVAPAADADTRGKVVFEPFIGIAPRRFEQWFAGLKRKNDDGRILKFHSKSAVPRVGNATDKAAEFDIVAATAREFIANNDLLKRLSSLQPTLTEMTHAPAR